MEMGCIVSKRRKHALDTCKRQIGEFDSELLKHCSRTAEITEAIIKQLKMNDDYIVLAAGIHDIGKICVPKEVLNKPGKLNTIERNMIDSHSFVGYIYTTYMEIPQEICELILFHHGDNKERFCYVSKPNNELLFKAQILQAADMYDAITSDRCYRRKLSHETAIEKIQKVSVNPEIIDALQNVMSSIGKSKVPTTGMEQKEDSFSVQNHVAAANKIL